MEEIAPSALLFYRRSSLLPMNDVPKKMSSEDLAHYIEQTNSLTKPWLLGQLRLLKLQERRDSISEAEYLKEIADIHQDMMNLGEWWKGIEDEVFG